MSEALLQELRLVWPGLLGAIFLILAILPRMLFIALLRPLNILNSITKLVSFDFSGWLVAVRSKSAQRFVLPFLALGLIIYVPFRDYAQFFPRQFSIQVYFDASGINRALNEFDARELAELKIDANWAERRRFYFARLDEELKAHSLPFVFSEPSEDLRGFGVGYIEAISIDGWATQRYNIVAAAGCIRLNRDSPKGQLLTFYSLRPSAANFIDLSLSDIYLMRPLVIAPQFDQRVILKSTNSPPRDHVLIAATKLRFLPKINIGTTIYLYTQDDGTRVPIGYAIYTPIAQINLEECLK